MEGLSPLQLSALGVFLLFMAGGVASWAFGAYYMARTLRGFRERVGWQRYHPLVLFRSEFFTVEGNVYRVRLLRALASFCFFIGVPLAFGFATESLAG